MNFLAGWTGSLEPGTGSGGWSSGDFDGDLDVDSDDLLNLLANWTGAINLAAPPPPLSVEPEPMTPGGGKDFIEDGGRNAVEGCADQLMLEASVEDQLILQALQQNLWVNWYEHVFSTL